MPEALHRGVSTTLILLDEQLCEIEQWATGRQQRSALYQEHNTLSDGQRKRILAELENAREVLQRLRDSLELQTETCDAASRIISLCSSAWPNLVELQGKHLRRYGEPSAELQAKLGPEIAALIDIITRIAGISRG